MSRILIHEPAQNHDECLSLLRGRGEEVVACHDHESLVDALAARRPDVLVYVIQNLPADLGLLKLLRRVAPALPLIVLGGPNDLQARREIQELKPTYYGVLPLDGSELGDAVRGALHRGTPRS